MKDTTNTADNARAKDKAKAKDKARRISAVEYTATLRGLLEEVDALTLKYLKQGFAASVVISYGRVVSVGARAANAADVADAGEGEAEG